MIVVLYFPHNEGVYAAIITEAGFDSDSILVDKHEVDAQVESVDTMEEAEKFMQEMGLELGDFAAVKGGLVHLHNL